MDQFIQRVYSLDPDLIELSTVRIAFKFLRTYLEERIAEQMRHDLMSSTYAPSDLCSLLEGYKTDVARVAALEPTGLSQPFPDGWQHIQKAVTKSSTGMAFLDHMLNGGQAEKEVYGLLGPTGSCKTTIALQYATWQANRARTEWISTDRQGMLKFVYMFIYESDIEEMRLRALSAFAAINRNVLEAGDWSKLSRKGQLKRYERDMFAEAIRRGESPIGELERFTAAQKRLNLNLRIIDMTGNDPEHQGRGWGLHDEIQQLIDMDQDHQRRAGINAGVGPIIIDYAGAAVERHLDAVGGNRDHKSESLRLISSFGMHCKNKLAIRFRTQVLALHQLRGEANSYAAGHIPKSSDAMGCKSWPTNLDFSLVIGTPTKSRHAVLVCDKHRRAPGSDEVVITVNGALSRVEHATEMTVDSVARRIVPVRDMRSIQDDDEDDTPLPSHGDEDDAYEHDTAVDQSAEINSRMQRRRRRD